MDRSEIGLRYFAEGFNCAQSVLVAFGPDLGLDRETALRLAGAFGGGIVGTGETCGAVTGALMAVGLKYGMADGADREAKERTRQRGRRLIEEFALTWGSTKCRELLGCNIGTAEGMERAHSSGVLTIRCPGFVGGAIQLLDRLL